MRLLYFQLLMFVKLVFNVIADSQSYGIHEDIISCSKWLWLGSLESWIQRQVLGSVSVCGYEFESFTPVYTPATWDIKIPHRLCLAVHKSTPIQFHLNPSQTTWIGVDLCAAKQAHRVQITLVYNNFLTRDNLSTRRRAEDSTCLFCCEHKIVHHLFFSCCLTIRMCGIVPEFLGLNIGTDLCKTLAAKKKHALNNIY